MSTFSKILGTLFRFGARVTFVILVLPALWLMEPFYRLRFGTMYTQRFGKLVANAELILRTLQLDGIPKRTFYLFFGWEPANRQLMEMWKRTRGYPVRFIESRWGARLMFAWRPIMRKTRFWEACQDTGVEYYLYNHTESELFFTEEEEEKGRVLLAKMGTGADDCSFVSTPGRKISGF